MLDARPLPIAVAVAVAAFAAGCAGMSGLYGGAWAGSGGDDGGYSANDGGGLDDGGSDGAGPDGGGPSSLAFVNASPSLGDIRLCWTVGAGATLGAERPFPFDAPMPASNYPGVPAGGATILHDASKLVGGPVTLYALDARTVAWVEKSATRPPTCRQLADVRSNDYLGHANVHVLAPIALGSGFQVVAIGGCLAQALDLQASLERCGAGWMSQTGNLHASALAVTPSPGYPGVLQVQTTQLSAAVASMGVVQVSVTTEAGTQGTHIATLGTEGQVAPPAPATVSIGSSVAAFGNLGVALAVVGPDGGTASSLWMSLAQAQSLFAPGMDPSRYYGQAVTYLIAVMGDPNAPHAFDRSADAGYDGRGLHALVLPTAGL